MRQNINDEIKESTEDTLCDNSLKGTAGVSHSDLTVQIGDKILFGKYPYTSKDDLTPIEWRVLAKEDGKILVIAERGLACKKYNNQSDPFFFENVNWEKCSLRTWLNGTFLKKAFSTDEKKQILATKVRVYKQGYLPGNDTVDKVFLLSVTDAKRYFTTDESRKCVSTPFAEAKGAKNSEFHFTINGEGTCWWWLRSRGHDNNSAATIGNDGSVNKYGKLTCQDHGCVRPAMWIKI